MSHFLYPQSFPLDCVSELIQIGRGGIDEIVARKAEVGLCLWTIQGYAQAQILGTPDNIYAALSADEEASIAEQLDDMLAVYQGAMGAQAGSVFSSMESFGARVNWVQLLRLIREWLPIILPLILDPQS